MKIHATFAWLEGAEGPSLIHAWDEFDVDENRDGFAEDQRKTLAGNAIATYDNGVPMVREVLVKIDYDRIEKLFAQTELEGELAESPIAESRGLAHD